MENGGDSIKLVSMIYEVSALEAVKIINRNLNLGLEIGEKKENNKKYLKINKYKEKRKIEQRFKEWENKTMQLLCDYLYLLREWQKSEDWESDLYLEAANKKDYIEYIMDTVFIDGKTEDKIWYWKYKGKELEEVESRVRFGRKPNK